ncbi:MAG: tRNA pseudouridine(55) synthase TruB [Caulobacteraceae bacterium]|nr:tRNA pseudouridine(55) synthase TruB [Caulobacter sp.]
MGRRKRGQAVNGWICLDKPEGLGSTDAVTRVRRLFDAQKAGHAGTLDPLASGVLPIALGEATKTVPYLMEADKTYRFTIEWGVETASFDREGEVTARSDARPTREAVEAALPAFMGAISQVPPAFSAIRIDGERAYDLARAGQEVVLEAREVVVHAAHVTAQPDHDHTEIEVSCGKGTYVRAIARDLASALGAHAHVSALRRTRVGRFSAAEAVTLEKLAEMVHGDAAHEALLPVETALDDIPALAVTEEDAFRLAQGRSVALLPRQVEELMPRLVPRTVAGQDAGRVLQARCKARLVALGELRAGRVEPFRIFNLQAS